MATSAIKTYIRPAHVGLHVDTTVMNELAFSTALSAASRQCVNQRSVTHWHQVVPGNSLRAVQCPLAWPSTAGRQCVAEIFLTQRTLNIITTATNIQPQHTHPTCKIHNSNTEQTDQRLINNYRLVKQTTMVQRLGLLITMTWA